ncbi:MAG: G/U mismatch-specific DNA glycosylase [Actinomycetes bacterium]
MGRTAARQPGRPGRPGRGGGPSRAELLRYEGAAVADVIAPGLRVLFCGINPGLYTAWAGHHFARPGNRFWPTLHRSGFTPRQLAPAEEQDLLALGLGVTNIVPGATATAAELTTAALRAGAVELTRRVTTYAPSYLAVLGVTAYRAAFRAPGAGLGPQPDPIGRTTVWVLPNPSGLNAHYQPPRLAELFAQLRLAAESN